MRYGVSAYIFFTVWNTAQNDGQAGDAGNLTLTWSKDDGTGGAPTNAPAEVGNGLYKLQLATAEAQTHIGALSGSSSTTNCVVMPLVVTFVRGLPDADADAAGGLMISDAGGVDVDTVLGRLDAAVTTRSSAADMATALSNQATIATYIDTEVGAIKAQTDQLTFSGSDVIATLDGETVGATVSDKTGYKLASDGLDSISTAAPTGVASNFREMFVQTWRRLFKKTTLTSTELKTFADDDSTVITTQSVSNNSGTQTVSKAS